MSDAVRYEVADGVATLTLDRVANRNALSVELVDALGDRLADAMGDAAVRVVVLANAGPAFCAGADLSGQKAGAAPRHTLAGVLSAILDAAKPVIGRISGHCMGGGVGLAAACDISVAADDVVLGFTEVRLGVAPAIISVVCLPKMRRADASELFLSGERISAARAAEVGLVNRAVPRGELDAAVGDVVAKVAAGGPKAVAAAKRLIAEVPHLERGTAFSWTEQLSSDLFASEEAAEGMAAFREKRAPRWADR